MIRQHEKSVVWQAGAFTVLVHGMLLALFLVSFQWKTVKPMSITEVELWDSVPSPNAEPSLPEPALLEPPESPKVVEQEQPEIKKAPEPEAKAEIQIKKVPVTPPKIEKPKEPPKLDKDKAEERLKQLKQAWLAEDAQSQKHEAVKPEASPAGSKTAQVSQSGSPNAGEIGKYKGLIESKIKQHVNKQLCGSSQSLEVNFKISLMPTGEVMGHPKFIKGSGIPACDEAIERAILESQPLPVPTSADLFSQFRDLNLVFRPNDNR
jgi:colicin import membrane protein